MRRVIISSKTIVEQRRDRRRARKAASNLGAIAAIAAVALTAAPHGLAAVGRWLAVPGEPRPADAIVVLGGNRTRSYYGLELYRRGVAPELWHTGYAMGEPYVTAFFTGNGVPPAAFAYLPTVSTWTDALAMARAARERGRYSLLIVTDWWHSRRALCAARRQLRGSGIAVHFTPSPSPIGPDDWWRDAAVRAFVRTELVKHLFYALHYGLWPWGC